jgi:hypothetical protein
MCGFQSTPGQSVTVQDGLPVFRSIFCVAQGTSVREREDGGGVVVQARLACIKSRTQLLTVAEFCPDMD